MGTRKLTDFSIERILSSKPGPGPREESRLNPRPLQQEFSHRPPQLGLAPLGMRFDPFGYQSSGYGSILVPHPPCCVLEWMRVIAQTGNHGTHVAGKSAQAQQCQRMRTVFTETQSRQLEALFHLDNFPSVEVRARLATRIGLGVETVRVWFKNRRARRKRQVRRSNKEKPLKRSKEG